MRQCSELLRHGVWPEEAADKSLAMPSFQKEAVVGDGIGRRPRFLVGTMSKPMIQETAQATLEARRRGQLSDEEYDIQVELIRAMTGH